MAEETTECRVCQVHGRVQGVFYRASTERQARSLGLVGYARNCPDGPVEVLMCGASTDCDELEAWLWDGPPLAAVTAVQCEQVDNEPPQTFTTG